MNKHFSIGISRLVLAMFVCLLSMNNIWAQTAVLQHEEEMSMFYGSDSFINAYNASVDGDVITLSEGNYNVCAVEKSITIHGAGACQDTVAGSFATFFPLLNVSSDPIIEGISFGGVFLRNMSSPKFVKCNILLVEPYPNSNSHCQTVFFTNCYILNLRLCRAINYNYSYIDNCHLVNSVVWEFSDFYGQNHMASNSIIRTTGNMADFTTFNSIIIYAGGTPTNTCTFYNCIGVRNGFEGSVFTSSLNSNVMELDTITDVFPAFVGEDIFNEEFILDEGIATGFLGNNGTEIGIHGGYYPYSSRPGYMRMRRCIVGDRTTDDGHLSVDIEVVTEE